jgi:hypothetical protein
MMRGWLQLALSDVGFLNGLFLSASRHLSQNHQSPQSFQKLAIQFRLACMQSVSQDISAGSVAIGDGTVANVLMLAWDEVRAYPQ